MFETTITAEIEDSAKSREPAREPLREPSREPAPPTSELRAKSAKELAAEYGVSDRTVQGWFRTVCAAYCWIEPSDLKVGSGNKIRYTVSFQELLAEYRAVVAEVSEADWIAAIHAANSDKLAPVVEPSEDEPEASKGAAIVPIRGAALAQYQAIEDADLLPILPTFKHVSTESIVNTELAKLDQLLNDSATFDEQIDQELIQQALNRGAQRGAMLARLEIAAAERVRRQAIAELGKKQGLQTEEAATP